MVMLAMARWRREMISGIALGIYGIFYYCLYRAYEAFQWRKLKRLVPNREAPTFGLENVKMAFELLFAPVDPAMGKNLRRMIKANRFALPVIIVTAGVGLMFGI